MCAARMGTRSFGAARLRINSCLRARRRPLLHRIVAGVLMREDQLARRTAKIRQADAEDDPIPMNIIE
jgi:hypothetical protein